VIIASVAALVLSIGLLYVGEKLGTPWRPVFLTLGSACAPIGLVGFIYEVALRRSVVAEFWTAADLSEDLAATGIEEIATFGSIVWQEFFQTTGGDVDICVGYAHTWAATHARSIVRQVGQTGHRLRVTLLNPEGPDDLLSFYARVYGTGVEGLREKITNSIKIWQDCVDEERRAGTTVRATVEVSDRHIPYTFYRSGNAMWVVLAPRRPGRVGDSIPAFKCYRSGERGLFNWITEDIEACRRDGIIQHFKEL
jgi:predicted nucleotidyltransferase